MGIAKLWAEGMHGMKKMAVRAGILLALVQLMACLDIWLFPYLNEVFHRNYGLTAFGIYSIYIYRLLRPLLTGLFLVLAAIDLWRAKRGSALGISAALLVVNVLLLLLHFLGSSTVFAIELGNLTLPLLLGGYGLGALLLFLKKKD